MTMPKRKWSLSNNLLSILVKALANTWPLATKNELLAAQQNFQQQSSELLTEISSRFVINPEDRQVMFERFDEYSKIVSWVTYALEQYQNDKENEKRCLYPVTIEWLFQSAGQPEINQDILYGEVIDVFEAFLEHNIDDAIKYYSSQPKFIQSPVLNAKADQSIVQSYLGRATRLLAKQTKPAGILPLFHIYFDKPYIVAALLIWAIKQGVAPEDIIRSSVLHDFVAKHIFMVGLQKYKPVEKVFSWLTQFDDDKRIHELVNQAQITSYYNNIQLSNYSLAGKRIKNDEPPLQTVEHKLPQLEFDFEEDKILNLYRCFGVAFLKKALGCLLKTNSLSLQVILQKLLPGSELASSPLNELIKSCANEECSFAREELFKCLAMVVSEDVVKKMLSVDTAILYILPHKPYLSTSITENLIKSIMGSNQSEPDILKKLIFLIKFLNQKDDVLTGLIFHEVIGFILSSSNETLITHSRNYVEILSKASLLVNKSVVSKKIDVHNKLFRQLLVDKTREPLTAEVYNSMKKQWIFHNKKLNLIRAIRNEKEAINDEDSFLLFFIVTFYEQQKESFSLGKILDVVTECYRDINAINNKKEKTCILILYAGRHKALLEQTVVFLENTLGVNNWESQNYRGEGFLSRAFRRNDISLLTLLSKKLTSDSVMPLVAVKAVMKSIEKEEVRSFIEELIANNKLNEHWVKIIIGKDEPLIKSLKNTSLNDWSELLDFLGDDHIKSIVNNKKVLATILKELPIDGWVIILDRLGRNYIKTFSQHFDVLYHISENASSDIVKAFVNIMPMQWFLYNDFNKTRGLVRDRYALGQIDFDLSEDDFSLLRDENFFYKTMLDYFVKMHNEDNNAVILSQSFQARMEDFRNIITCLVKFFDVNKGKNPSGADLKVYIDGYFNSEEGRKVNAYFAAQGNNNLFSNIILPPEDIYQKYRNFLVNIPVKTLQRRLEEFRETILELLASNGASASKSVALKIETAFVVGGIKVKQEKNTAPSQQF